MNAQQLLVTTGGSALAVWAYNYFKLGYDGITNPAEVKGIEVVGAGVIAMVITMFLYGSGGFDLDDITMALIEGGAAVAFSRIFTMATGM